MEPVVLRTERLVLSLPATGDVDAIHDACQDADIQRYTMVPAAYSRADAEGFVHRSAARWAEGVEVTWALRAQHGLAGVMGIHDIGRGNASLGYWMAPTSRGLGLATEAASAVLDWAFSPEGLDLVRLEWRAVVGNLGSARIAQRLGFRFEGTLRKEFVNGLGRHDGWIAGLLKDDDRMPRPWPFLDA